MIIGIPSTGKALSSSFAQNFGRCPFFIIYDTDTQEIKMSYANDAQSAAGGAGIQASQSLINNKVEVVIVPQVGPNAWNVLKGANVRIFSGIRGSVQDNIIAFETGELTETSHADSSGRGRGGRGQGRGRF